MASKSHRLQFAIAKYRAACLALLCFAWSTTVQSQSTDISGRIDVRNVDSAALLYAVAEAVNFNIVAPIPKGAPTVSLSTEYSSVDDLLHKLAKQVGMRGVVLGHRILVLSPCLHDQARNTPPQAQGQGQLSLRVPNGTLSEVFELSSPGLPLDGNRDSVTALSSRVALRLINVSPDDVHQAVSAAFGGEVASGVHSKFIVPPAGAEGCPGAETSPLTVQQEQLKSLRHRESNCPYRTGSSTKSCWPLEYFSLKQLHSRGYIESEGRRFAFVEAPDGLLHVARNGAYMGHDYGKVLEVTQSGIQLREFIEDPANGWMESKFELQHWKGTHPSQTEAREAVQATSVNLSPSGNQKRATP
jgi:Tfp pilus assembly protein PilP